MTKTARSPLDRLMERVKKVPNGCWIWQGAINRLGYGRIRVGSHADRTSRVVYTHRLSYEFHVGPIPDDLVLDHLCHNPVCCNPAHLEAVPQRVNLLRGIDTLAAVSAGRTECAQGHAFTPENTRIDSRSGRRYCRACGRARSAAYTARRATR